MPILPSSALTKAIAKLSDKEAIKASALPGRLLKTVKPEELDYSGVAERIRELDPEYKVTKKELLEWDANRADKWGETNLKASKGQTSYNSTTIPDTTESTYEESIRKFNTAQEEPDFSLDPNFEGNAELTGTSKQRVVSSHFDNEAPNYFAHSRTSIEPIGDVGNTRVIQELQSDLHQKGRVVGYQGTEKVSYIIKDPNGEIVASSTNKADLSDWLLDNPGASIEEVKAKGVIPDAPLKRNWARKEIERQILKAVDEDQGAIAIPLEGNLSSLARTGGVPKWYETQVRSTMKKIARQIPGAEYKEVTSFVDNSKAIINITNDNNEVFDFVMENPDIGRSIVGDAWDTLDFELADENSLSMVNRVIDGIMTVDSPDGDLLSTSQWERINNIFRPTGDITFGQIILPPSEKISGSWPELTPVVKKVFKRWENPPKDLKELNKLQKELPDSFNEAIQYVSTNKALNDLVLNTEELKLAINKHATIYSSAFDTRSLYNTLEELSLDDIASMPEGLRTTVERAKAILDDPQVVIDFMEKEWDQISKEQKLPFTKTEVTSATYKYPEWTKKFELYSAGALAIAAGANPEDANAQEANAKENNPVGELLKQKADPFELEKAVMNKNGLTQEQARQEIVRSIQANVDAVGGDPERMREAVQKRYGEYLGDTELNYGEEEQQQDFQETPLANEPTFELVPIADNVEAPEKSVKELKAASENFLAKYSDITKFAKGFIFEDSQALEEFATSMKEMDYHIANNLRQMGRNVEVTDDGLVVIDSNGNAQPINDDFWSDAGWSLAASEKEIGFGVGSALVANKIASKWLLNSPTIPGKLAGAALVGIDILAGATGTTVGRGLDLAYNSYTEKEKVEAGFYQEQMIDAGIFDTVMGSVLFGTFKAMRGTILAAGRAFKKITAGNKKGAYEALKNFTNLDEKEIDEIITKWEQVSEEKLKGTKEEQAMKVISQTQPDAEALVASAAQYDPALTMNLARSIDARAKDVIKLAEHASPDNIGVVVKDELEKYTAKVKTFFDTTKKAAVKEVPKTYKFNYNKLAVKPFMKEIRDKITNPAIQDRVTLYLNKVERFEDSSSFADLLDLRRTMNDFKYNTRIRGYIDFKTINNIIGRIDREVAKTVSANMKEGDIWLKNWKMANTEYSKMKVTSKNVLFKAITKAAKDGAGQGQNTKNMVTALTKHISDIDGTFMQVVSKLPENTRKMVEGAVIENIVGKYTIGEASGLQAINFPELAKELKSIGFTSAKARDLKRGVTMLAEVFKNDPKLNRLSNTIHTKGVAQALTDDLVMKARYSLMAKIWSRMQSIMPFNNNSQFIALGLNIEKVLRTPGKAKAVNDLIKMFPKDTEIADGVRQLALVSAKFGEPENYPYVPLSKIGSAAKVRDGKLGKGAYWSTDASDIRARAAPNKLKVSKREVLPERIATEADVKSVLKSLGLDKSLVNDTAAVKANQDALQKELKSRGYEGFAIGHDVLIFPGVN